MSEPRFAGDMRWVVRWVDDCGNESHPGYGENVQEARILQVGVPNSAGPSVWFTWEDVPTVDTTTTDTGQRRGAGE